MAHGENWWVRNATERYWLEATDRSDIGANLKAPVADAGGATNWRYSLFREARPGDIVYHYDKNRGAITSWSRIAGKARSQPIVWAARGSYARRRGAEPIKVAGYVIPLDHHSILTTPVTLKQLRNSKPALTRLVKRLRNEVKKPLYFPFELSRRPVRPLQGYAFKLPAAFVAAFRQLSRPGSRHLRERTQRREPLRPGGEAARRSYWVVSPNVRNYRNKKSVDEWRRASVRAHAAFMGWWPDDEEHGGIGPKFAGESPRGIAPGDVILIARHYRGQPEMVGFGVVSGKALKRAKGLKTPDSFGSLRRLRPFKPWSRSPADVPFRKVLRHRRALVQLHPDRNRAHQQVCEWLDENLRPGQRNRGRDRGAGSTARGNGAANGIKVVSSKQNAQLDYKIRTRAQVIRAQALEARLVEEYRSWLERQQRTLRSVSYGALRCDGYEQERDNLIEAKSSIRREHIRMAVGQLSEYAFRGRKKFGATNQAILLPKRPSPDIFEWLDSIGIRVIWREKGRFMDDGGGQFT